ncbi:hypothetical protein R5R35_007778 [Gryllus longicercus]|uniref:Uncharacterized protein n=1 Tax=Gryllus longicercus TaxID=2509291 RepID=A0AAN9W153_9ORTH
MHHATLPQKNTPNNMSRLDIAQQILKRLTVDIQAQHARICDNTYKSCHLSENSQQPIDAVSHVPEELEETNTQLGSVSLIIQKNQGIVNPLAASSSTQESPEISVESSQPASTVTWKFWHPQSSSWVSLSLPEKNAHEMLQSAEPVKRNFENLLQSALNVRNPSINADPKLTEKGVFPNSMSLAPEIPNEQEQNINEQLRNEPADVELRFEDPQDRVTTFLNKGNDTTLSSEEIPATNVQYPERTNVPQIQSSSEGKPPPQSPVDESQTCSAIPVEKPSNDHRDPNIKTGGTSPEDNALLNMHLTSSVVWRLWEPNSGSWVSLNISKGNPEQVIEQVNIQDANLETETGKSTEGPKENSTPNSSINENTVIPKGENISSTTQTQKLEASLMILNHFSKTETQTAQLDNGIDSESKELYLSNFVIKPLTPNLQSGQQSPVLTNDIWSDSPTSHLESTDAETWGVWPTSSLESLSVRKTRSIKRSSSHRRRQKSSNADTPRKNIAGTTRLRGSQSNTRADATDERNLLRYPSGPKTSPRSELAIKRWLQRRQVPSSGTKTFLRSELAIKRCLQRRQVPSMNARSNHRLKFERWRRQRSLVNTDYHRQYHQMRRSSVSPHENFTARSAEEANLNSVETPSLLLLCLTADSSLLPRARYQRSNKKQYCIIQNTTTKKFGNPEQVPWKRASRQWRKNLATDK